MLRPQAQPASHPLAGASVRAPSHAWARASPCGWGTGALKRDGRFAALALHGIFCWLARCRSLLRGQNSGSEPFPCSVYTSVECVLFCGVEERWEGTGAGSLHCRHLGHLPDLAVSYSHFT